MEEYLTPDRIANSIMQDETFNGLYVLVEGNKDYKLFSKFFDLTQNRIKQTFGCNKLLQVFEILKQRGFERKIGIIDRDFREITDELIDFENIFITDYHDIEVMIIQSKAFDNVLNLYSLPEKIEKFEKKVKRPLREIIFELSDKIGYLKLTNFKYDFGLAFKPDNIDGNPLKYHEFISDTLDYKGDDALIKTVVNYSRNKTRKRLSEKEIKDKLIETSSIKYDSKQLSNGHDLSNVIFIFLKKNIRSSNKMLHDYNCVEDSLILAYEYEDFKKTKLYMDLSRWSEINEHKLFDKE
jgi:hypothetical protein